MNVSDLPFRVFGDTAYRGKCPMESAEQVSVVNRIRMEYPETWGRLLLHPRNEGLKERGQFSAVMKHRAEGMSPGAADLVIPAGVSFVCELKRRDRTLSSWQPGQIEYLTAAHEAGAFACVALGALAAWEAFEMWLGLQHGNL